MKPFVSSSRCAPKHERWHLLDGFPRAESRPILDRSASDMLGRQALDVGLEGIGIIFNGAPENVIPLVQVLIEMLIATLLRCPLIHSLLHVCQDLEVLVLLGLLPFDSLAVLVEVDLQWLHIFVEPERAHRPQQIVSVDSLSFLVHAFVASLGGYEANELRVEC